MDFPVTRPPTPPYNLQKEDNVIRTATDGGYVITRSKYTRARYTTMNFKWQYMTTSEYQALLSFMENDSKNCSLPFNFTLKTDTIETVYKVIFKSPPKLSYVGMGLWEVDCEFQEV